MRSPRRQREPLCPECEHPVYLHSAKYGCEHEPGDVELFGEANGVSAIVARPPCGCTAVVQEDKTCD